MIVLLLLALILIGVTAMLAVRALTGDAVRRTETLAQIAGYGFAAAVSVPIDDPRPRGLRAVVERLASHVGAAATAGWTPGRRTETRLLLRSAGLYQMEVATFVGYRVLATAVLPALLLLVSASGGGIGARTILLVGFVGAMAWVLPSFVIKRRAAQRLERIDREVPELVDLLVTTVEAGVGFAAALQLVARRVEGPLGQELRISLREQGMGLTVEDALQNMVARVDSISVRSFVQAIVQGQLLGVSIGKILRDLAVDMRKRRRQLAEERAQKAPTKILFPLVFLILPALFIIVLGGPIIGLGKTFGAIS